jgi:hypothetical protein
MCAHKGKEEESTNLAIFFGNVVLVLLPNLFAASLKLCKLGRHGRLHTIATASEGPHNREGSLTSHAL